MMNILFDIAHNDISGVYIIPILVMAGRDWLFVSPGVNCFIEIISYHFSWREEFVINFSMFHFLEKLSILDKVM